MKSFWNDLAPNSKGAILMTLSGLTYSFVAAQVKELSQPGGLDGFEPPFFRALFGFVCLFPFLAVAGKAGFRTRYLSKHVCGACSAVSRCSAPISASASWRWRITRR